MIELTLILLAILQIIAGVLMFIFTDAAKEILRSIMKEKNLKVLSVLPVAVGILLLAGSPLVSTPWITVMLGILAIAKGLFFIFGQKRDTRALIDWWMGASNNVYKSWGVVSFLLGVLLLLIL